MSSYSQSAIYHSIFSDIYTVFCGMQDCTPSYSFGPAVRDCYLLHLCLEGEGVFYSGEERYPIKQGQGFLIHPGKLTFYQADSVNLWSYLWVGIGGHDAEKYLRLAGLSARNPIFSCTQIDTAKSYILDMMKHHALSTSNEFYIQGLLMQFLALLVEDAGCTVSPQQNTSSVYINQAISYIHKNYQNPLTVQEIADYLSLNRSYLTELFLKTVQLSPQQFLTRYRITKSEELLQSSSLSIQNIACSCGYSNSFSFSKAFRKVNGLSPSEYRKQKEGDERNQHGRSHK